jgi:hypothetical protein
MSDVILETVPTYRREARIECACSSKTIGAEVQVKTETVPSCMRLQLDLVGEC